MPAEARKYQGTDRENAQKKSTIDRNYFETPAGIRAATNIEYPYYASPLENTFHVNILPDLLEFL